MFFSQKYGKKFQRHSKKYRILLLNFRKKLNVSIDSCLNVQKLKEKNLQLKELNNSLIDKVEKAVEKSKEKEKQFFEQLKMAQMGELIGNIAHQWRQPLSIISTAASGMKMKKEISSLSDEDFHYYCDNIISNSTYLSNKILIYFTDFQLVMLN